MRREPRRILASKAVRLTLISVSNKMPHLRPVTLVLRSLGLPRRQHPLWLFSRLSFRIHHRLPFDQRTKRLLKKGNRSKLQLLPAKEAKRCPKRDGKFLTCLLLFHSRLSLPAARDLWQTVGKVLRHLVAQ